MLRGRPRGREQALVLGAAEIGAFEQLGRKHHGRTLARSLADQLRHGADIRARILAESELKRGDGELGHRGTCWLMQWKLPPPVSTWSARRPIATRLGNSS